jgi:malonyl-CoA/methylmalonyl-CoA synthetase
LQKLYITDYLKLNADNLGNKTAVTCSGQSLTWQELWRDVEATSNKLAGKIGADKQQLVSLLMPNSIEYVVAYLAIIHSGHVAVPVDVIYKPLEIEAIIKQIPTALIITDESNRARISSNLPLITLDELMTEEAEGSESFRADPKEMIATIFFTSGTTGKPKAAPYTHTNHLWNINVCSQVWDWTSDDSLLISLRLSHWYGSVMGLTGAIYHGNSFYLTDRFDVEDILSILSSGKVSMFTHAPLAYAKMAETEKDYDLSKVRLFISGSGPLSPSVWQSFKDRYGQEILEVYGSSETGRIASNLLNERIPGSPGRPLPGVLAKIESDGELAVKSDGLFPGYYQNEPLTAQHLTSDGYWKTGDIASLSEGRIILKGRTHEIIRRMGYTVSPRDIEWALLTNPGIKEVSVLASQTGGSEDDELVYFIVTDMTDGQVEDFCKQSLPSIWRPNKIIKLTELPRTSNGKVSIPKLRAMVNW